MSEAEAFTIRLATPQNAAALRALRLAALRDNPTAFASDFESESKDSVADWAANLADASRGVIFIAVANSIPVAMTGIGLNHHAKQKHNAVIWGVYVIPEWRGKKIADSLLGACIRWAREHAIIRLKLWVSADNAPAVASYIRSGFRVYGVEAQAIYYEGVYYDDLLMVCET